MTTPEPLPSSPAPDCVFCKIAAQVIPAPLLHSDEHCVAFADIHPQAPTHVLVIPRQHVASLTEVAALPQATAEPLLGHLLAVATQLTARLFVQESGFRVVINTGADAGQSVSHLHLHVLGGRPLSWPPG